MFGQQFPSNIGSSGVAEAIAIAQNVNALSVEVAWLYADENKNLDKVIRAISGLEIESKTVLELAQNSDELDAVLLNEDLKTLFIQNTAIIQLIVENDDAASGFFGNSGVMTAVAASSSAVAAILDSQKARFRVYQNDEAIAAMVSNSSAKSSFLAAGLARSKAENGTNSVSLESGVGGGNLDPAKNYIVLAVGLEFANGFSITMQTRRSNSARPATIQIFGSTSSPNNDWFTPVTGPLSFSFNNDPSGNNTTYFLFLDCTPPA